MYTICMNCTKLGHFASFKEAYEDLVKRIRKNEKEGRKINYGVNCFVVGNIIYEIVKEDEE